MSFQDATDMSCLAHVAPAELSGISLVALIANPRLPLPVASLTRANRSCRHKSDNCLSNQLFIPLPYHLVWRLSQGKFQGPYFIQ